MLKPYRFRQPRPTANKAISVTDATTQLALLLAGARSLDNFTAEGLAKTYRVPLKECARRLEAARASREQQA